MSILHFKVFEFVLNFNIEMIIILISKTGITCKNMDRILKYKDWNFVYI